MTKKIAEGTGALVLDVKVGTGAFMKDVDDARELAETMVALGTDAGVHTVALLTDMSTPLGLTAGNAIEVAESVEVLAGGGPADVVELTLALAREMLAGAGRDDVDPADKLADGSAMDAWKAMIRAQDGDPDAALPEARESHVVTAPASGVLTRLDAMAVGLAAWRLGAGRARKEDPVQAGAGVVWHARPGDKVTEGEPLLHAAHRRAGPLRAGAGLAGGDALTPTSPTDRRSVTTDLAASPLGASIPTAVRAHGSARSRTTVSATQAGLASPSISIVYLSVTCLPAGRSVTSPIATCARIRLPTRTGLGKRTLLTP